MIWIYCMNQRCISIKWGRKGGEGHIKIGINSVLVIMLWKIYINCITLNYHMDLLFPFISSVVLLTSPLEIINHFLSRKFSLFLKKIKLQLHGKLSFQSFHITSYEFKIFSTSPPFFGLKKHFLKDLNRISSYKCNTICLYIHFFWRTSCLLTHFNNFEKSCSKNLYSCFLGKILLFWVHLSAFNFLPDIH